jgi:hypothetical protein
MGRGPGPALRIPSAKPSPQAPQNPSIPVAAQGRHPAERRDVPVRFGAAAEIRRGCRDPSPILADVAKNTNLDLRKTIDTVADELKGRAQLGVALRAFVALRQHRPVNFLEVPIPGA